MKDPNYFFTTSATCSTRCLGISISTLQDTRKTQNKVSMRIFENARYTKIFLTVLVLQILLFTGIGLKGLFGTEMLADLSFGFISIGIGMIRLLKGAIEIAENLTWGKWNSNLRKKNINDFQAL